MAGIDINRTTSGVNLPRSISNEIWSDAQDQSVVMQRARRVDLPGGGVSIPIITGDPVAEFVDETEEKPVSRGTLDNKEMDPKKIAVIEPFSMEFRRDLPRLYNALRSRLGGAIAKTFDQAALHGVGAPTGNFDTLATAPTASLNTPGSVYADLLTALGTVAAADGDITAWVISTQGEIKVLGEVDGDGRPLFTNSAATDGSISNLLGRPVFRNRGVYKADVTATAGGANAETLGFGGDWQSAAWGQVETIQISVSDQATLNDGGTSLNLWQRNMFAVRAEIEVGFRVRDVNRFVRLIGADAGA